MRQLLKITAIVTLIAVVLFSVFDQVIAKYPLHNTRFYVQDKVLYREHDNNIQPFNIQAIEIDDYMPQDRSEEERIAYYTQWLSEVQAIGINTLSIPYLVEDIFYEVVSVYNEERKKVGEEPLYILQHIPIEETWLVEGINKQELGLQVEEQIEKIVDAMHGKINYLKHFDLLGQYDKNLSEYVIGYSIGNTLSSEAVIYKNLAHDALSYKGEFVQSETAGTPYEAWVGEVMDYIAVYSKKMYNKSTIVQLSQSVYSIEQETAINNYADMNKFISTDEQQLGIVAAYEVAIPIDHVLNGITDEGVKAHYTQIFEKYVYTSKHPVMLINEGLVTTREYQNALYDSSNGLETLFELVKVFYDLPREVPTLHTLIGRWTDRYKSESWKSIHRPEQNNGLLGIKPFIEGVAFEIDGNTGEWHKEIPVVQDGDRKLYVAYDTQYVYMNIETENPSELLIAIDSVEEGGDLRIGGADFIAMINADTGKYYAHDYAAVYEWMDRYKLIKQRPDTLETIMTSTLWYPFRVTAITAHFEKEIYQSRVPYPAYTLRKYDDLAKEAYHADYAVTDAGFEVRLSWEMLAKFIIGEGDQDSIGIEVGLWDGKYTSLMAHTMTVTPPSSIEEQFIAKPIYNRLRAYWQQIKGDIG